MNRRRKKRIKNKLLKATPTLGGKDIVPLDRVAPTRIRRMLNRIKNGEMGGKPATLEKCHEED